MDKREIKTKRPWKRIRPEGYMRHGTFMADNEPFSQNDPCYYTMVTQSDFMREYYPSGHVINDHEVYPDIYRMEEEPVLDENGEPTGKTNRRIYKELVPRYSFALQIHDGKTVRLIVLGHLGKRHLITVACVLRGAPACPVLIPSISDWNERETMKWIYPPDHIHRSQIPPRFYL